ncbi:MAG: energy transducer TonB, partial [Pseudomonadota bacterium]
MLPRSPGTLAAVMLAHAAVVALLLTARPAPQPPTLPAPLFVRLIEPAVTPPAPVVSPPPPPQAPRPPPTPTPPPRLPPVLTATPPLPL